MACMTMFAPPLALTTTQLARVVRYEDGSAWQLEARAESTPLRMSWVVVSDRDGKPKLQIQWARSADLC